MEVGEQVLALDLLARKAHLAVARLVLVQIGQADLEDTAAQTVSGNLGARGLVNERLADLALKPSVET